MERALPRAWLSAGNNIPAKIAMIAITTNNSTKVKRCFISISIDWVKGPI